MVGFPRVEMLVVSGLRQRQATANKRYVKDSYLRTVRKGYRHRTLIKISILQAGE
jgi:hypothetical protein